MTKCDPTFRASVNDTLVIGNRLWSVTGDFMGGAGQESVLGLQVIGAHHDATAHGKDVPELFVPEIMLRRLSEGGLMSLIRASGSQPEAA